jgi:HPt (histidine-containing phosphotransfer) domain-containing protein
MANNVCIDERTFRELREAVGDDYIPELIRAYLDETPGLIQDLQEALAAGDAIRFTRAAHSIKSSSASLGALNFSAQAKELEMIGKSGDLGTAGEKLGRLIGDYPAVELALITHSGSV